MLLTSCAVRSSSHFCPPYSLPVASQSPPPLEPDSAPPNADQANLPSATPRTLDQVFEDISTIAPSFSGLYFEDGGALIVRATEPFNRQNLISAIEEESAGRFPRSQKGSTTSPSIRVEPALYSFQELREWKEQFVADAWTRDVVEVDIDEVRNLLEVGVKDEASAEQLTEAVGHLGIPSSAVDIYTKAPPVLEAADLRDRFRPIPGGVEIEDEAGGSTPCTLMVNVSTSDEGEGFLTNSHCTWETFGGADLKTMYQNTKSSSNAVGYEVADPPLNFGGSTQCQNNGCRHSDAAFIQYDSGSLSQHGTVARPGSLGSITLDGAKVRWLIQGGSFGVAVGDSIHRVGRTTGWRKGKVTDTCTDVSHPDGGIMLCQAYADYTSSGGDSGSPVFSWDGIGDYVDIEGIHWGAFLDGTKIFSEWAHITLEIGAEVGTMDISY